MGKDDLPTFPTPAETFGNGGGGRNNGQQQQQQQPPYNVPPPPQPRYGPNGYQPPQQPGYGPPPPQRHYPSQQQAPPPQGHHGGGYGAPPPQPNYRPPPPMEHNSYPQSQPPMTFGPSHHHNQQPPQPPPPPPPPPPQPQPQQSRQSPRMPPARMNSAPSTAAGPNGGRSTPDTNLRALFNGVDRNGNGILSEAELGSALVNGDYTKFNKDTVRLMIKMFDRNGDGAINYEEFGNLWRYLRDWRKIFDKFDMDRSGSISFDEYCRALNAFGYSLSNQCIHNMYTTYSHVNRYGDRTISFDMFVQSCINLKRITDSFKRYDTDRDGYVTVGFEQFLLEVMSLK